MQTSTSSRQTATVSDSVIDALHYRHGHVGKSDILAFVPHANVGASTDAAKDVRWVHIDGQEVHDRDWIVKLPSGRILVFDEDTFIELFAPTCLPGVAAPSHPRAERR